MKIGRLEIFWNRSSGIVPGYVNFTGADSVAGLLAGGMDLRPIKSDLGALKDGLDTTIENQIALDELMRRVGLATDRNSGTAAETFDLVQTLQKEGATAAGVMLEVRALLDERTNQILGCLEDAAISYQAASGTAVMTTNPETTAQSMNDLGAKEEERTVEGRRIWTIGRVRVYECRVGGGEKEVRAAIAEIKSLRKQREGYSNSVDLLAVAVPDLAFPSALEKTFINDTVLDRISFVPPEFLSTFVRLCMKKQPKPPDQPAHLNAQKPADAEQSAPSLGQIRSKIARAHGQLQSGNTKNASAIIGEVIKLLGGEESKAQQTNNNDASRATDNDASRKDQQHNASESEPTAQDSQVQKQTKPRTTGQDTSADQQAAKPTKTNQREKRTDKQTRLKENDRTSADGAGKTLQLTLEPGVEPNDPVTNAAPLVIATAGQKDQTEGEQRA